MNNADVLLQDYLLYRDVGTGEISISPSLIGGAPSHTHTITTSSATIAAGSGSLTSGTATIRYDYPWTDGGNWRGNEWTVETPPLSPSAGTVWTDDRDYWKVASGSTWVSLGLDKNKVLELMVLLVKLITEHNISPKIILDIHNELSDGEDIDNIIKSLKEFLKEPDELLKDFETELDNLMD